MNVQVQQDLPAPVAASTVTQGTPSVLPVTRFRVDWVAVGFVLVALAGLLLLVFVGLQRVSVFAPLTYPAVWWLSMIMIAAGFLGFVIRAGRRWTR